MAHFIPLPQSVWDSLFVPQAPHQCKRTLCSRRKNHEKPDMNALLQELKPLFELTEEKGSTQFDSTSFESIWSRAELFFAWAAQQHLPLLNDICGHPLPIVQVNAITAFLELSQEPFINKLVPLLRLELCEQSHYLIMKRISNRLLPTRYRRDSDDVDYAKLEPFKQEIFDYLIRMLYHPSPSRRAQASVILGDGKVQQALPHVARLCDDRTELHTTDWDEIPGAFDLLPATDYPWRTQIAEYAEKALREINCLESLEKGWLKPSEKTWLYLALNDYPEIAMQADKYPHLLSHLDEQAELTTLLSAYKRLLKEKSDLDLGRVSLAEEDYSTFLQVLSAHPQCEAIPFLGKHLEQRNKIQVLKIPFLFDLLESENVEIKRIGLQGLIEQNWPETLFWCEQKLSELNLDHQVMILEILGQLSGPKTIDILLQYADPSQDIKLQIAACLSLIQLNNANSVRPLIEIILANTEDLDDGEIKTDDGKEIWEVPQFYALQKLASQAEFHQLIRELLLQFQQKNHVGMELYYFKGLVKEVGFDTSDPLLQETCHFLLRHQPEQEQLSEQVSNNKVLFLADFADRSCVQTLWPILQDDLFLKADYLGRVLVREDLPFLERLSQQGTQNKYVLLRILKSMNTPESLALWNQYSYKGPRRRVIQPSDRMFQPAKPL